MKQLVTKNVIVSGYRGYQSRSIRLACGHYYMAQVYGRERKYRPGKTKMNCWKCDKNPPAAMGSAKHTN